MKAVLCCGQRKVCCLAQIEEVEVEGAEVTISFIPSSRQDLPPSRRHPQPCSVISFALPSAEVHY